MKDFHTRNIEEQRSRIIIDSSPDAVVILDVDTGKFVDFNEKALKLLKLSRKVLLTLGPWDITPESSEERFSKAVAKKNIKGALMGGNPVFDWMHLDSEGNEIPCEIRLIRFPTSGRQVVMGSIVDLREKIRFEDKYHENIERLKLTLESTGLACFDWSSIDRVSHWDKNIYELLGIDSKKIKPGIASFLNVVHPEDLPRIRLKMAGFIESKKDKEYFQDEFRIIRNDSIRFIYTYGSIIRNLEKKSVRILGTLQDWTEKKEVQSQLEYQAKLLENVSDVIFSTDLNFRITSWNQAACKLYGWTEKEVLGKPFHELLTGRKYESSVRDFFSNLMELGEWKDTVIHKSKNGNELYIQSSINLVFDKDGNPQGAIAINRNRTQEKENEKQRLKARQLKIRNKELEQFAYVASHDLQEPLHSMLGFTELLLEKEMLGKNEEARRYLGYIKDSASRMSNLVKGLLDYSRIGRTKEIFEVDCKLVVENVLNDLHSLVDRTKARIVINKLPAIKAVHTEVQMLFQNLLSNAIKFHKEGEFPNVELGCQKKGNFWQFYVKDNGIGIAKKHMEKIFILFQRLNTRNDYDGTGIGLAHCQKIVEMLGGQLWVESEVDKGSCFYFTIPE